MSTSDSLAPSGVPPIKRKPKRSRFSGERFGAWVFAASFSLGIWGLALKVMAPGHPAPTREAPIRYAVIAPSDTGDGKAAVVWATDASTAIVGYPAAEVVPVIPLEPATPTEPHSN